MSNLLHIISFCFCFLLSSHISLAQYSINFEGAGEIKTGYPTGTVTLSSLNWSLTQSLIGTATNDFKNGARSLRMRGYSTSDARMTQDKANGIGNISFEYRRFGTDAQVSWQVQYSTDGGTNWTNIGSPFTATATTQTFSENVNVTGNIRVRITHDSGGNTTTDRRMNIDDIVITDYLGFTPTISLNKDTVSNFKYRFNSGPSGIDSVNINATKLIDSLRINVNPNYEISNSISGPFSNYISLSPALDSSVVSKIYIRLKEGLATGKYDNLQIEFTSLNADTQYVDLFGKVLGLPGFMTGAMINACGQEGRNEFLVIRNESTPLTVHPENIDIRYGLTLGTLTQFTDTISATGNATFVNAINDSLPITCDLVFVNATLNTIVPPYRRLFITRSNADFYPNYSGWCGLGIDTIYVAFSASANWNQSGNFANSGTADRYFRAIINEDTTDIYYYPDSLSGDGSFVTFPENGGIANAYKTYTNCNPPMADFSLLPIELLSFTAEMLTENVMLEWITASELNNDYFEVLRSLDGLEWQMLDLISGSGTTNQQTAYSYLDKKPLNGINYYRLKQVDFDGQSSLSPIRSVDFVTKNKTHIYPNPSNNEFNLICNVDGIKDIKIFNSIGAEIKPPIFKDENFIKISLEGFPRGSYILQLNDGSSITSKLIVLK